MLNAMDRISELPDDTKIFVGHEYTVKNLEFGAMAEPENKFLTEKTKEFQELINQGYHTVPSILKEEKLFNVFMRCRTSEIQNAVGKIDPAECMSYLREFKNSGTRPKI